MAEFGTRVRAGSNPRGEDTRQRILRAALELFGSHGFEATSTRALAQRAEVTLPAIQYYFGSKEGLYRAVIHQITERIVERLGPVAARVQCSLAATPSRQDLLHLLCELTDAMTALMLDETFADRDSCRRFFARVEIEQGEANDIVHDCAARHILAPGTALIGRLLGLPPDDEAVRMRMVALSGQVKAFACWGSDRMLGWQQAQPERVSAVQALLRDHVMAIFRAPGTEPA